MEYKPTVFSVSDIVDGMDSKRFIINREYQRSAGLWPAYAKTYFIDTILEGFPFPSIYIYQNFDRITKKTFQEIIDGQQRVSTIIDYVNNRFKLGIASQKFKGMFFKDLEPEDQEKFLRSSVEALFLQSASRPEILEMFRRMNAYTLPLNSAEKRNAQFQGEFKWYINDLGDKLSPLFEEFGILGAKQILRQLDTEFLAELCLAVEDGVVTKSFPKIDKLYKDQNIEITIKEKLDTYILDFFNDFVINNLSELKKDKIMQSNNLHDLFIAASHLKYGIPNLEKEIGVAPIGAFYLDKNLAISGLQKLNESIDIESEEEWAKSFVVASKRSTTKKPERLIKVSYYIKALKGEIF